MQSIVKTVLLQPTCAKQGEFDHCFCAEPDDLAGIALVLAIVHQIAKHLDWLSVPQMPPSGGRRFIEASLLTTNMPLASRKFEPAITESSRCAF